MSLYSTLGLGQDTTPGLRKPHREALGSSVRTASNLTFLGQYGDLALGDPGLKRRACSLKLPLYTHQHPKTHVCPQDSSTKSCGQSPLQELQELPRPVLFPVRQ